MTLFNSPCPAHTLHARYQALTRASGLAHALLAGRSFSFGQAFAKIRNFGCPRHPNIGAAGASEPMTARSSGKYGAGLIPLPPCWPWVAILWEGQAPKHLVLASAVLTYAWCNFSCCVLFVLTNRCWVAMLLGCQQWGEGGVLCWHCILQFVSTWPEEGCRDSLYRDQSARPKGSCYLYCSAMRGAEAIQNCNRIWEGDTASVLDVRPLMQQTSVSGWFYS